ncbi:MAG: LysR family transcriptional regulator [Rhizobiaceae bacterium]|nr:LysR family transcriptional regulator [Rhizobiaceae bacterium]|tara:strand:+ start:62290 stop:63201 length:912 start_codon:yes stop_codon:yes gene_type:complete
MRIHSSAIHYFDAVRRAGSIREAARRLNVASSAVNRQILKLEDLVGTPLFDRSSTGVSLSSAGEILAHHVIVVLQDLDRARAEIDALKGARIGHLTIGAVEGVCTSLLPIVLRELKERAPRITYSVDSMGSAAIPEQVQNGLTDIGIAFNLPRSPELRQIFVAKFKLGAIMAPDHPLAQRECVTFSDCADYPMVYASNDLSISQLLDPLITQSKRTIDPAMRTNSIDLMRQLAMQGSAIGFQTLVGLDRSIAMGELVHVPLDAKGPVWSDLGIYVRAGRSVPAAVDLFLKILVEEIQMIEGAG